MIDRQRLIQQATRALANRERSLKNTLDEITELERLNQPPLVELTDAIASAKTKRDRQTKAIDATRAVIKALTENKAASPQKGGR